MITSILASNAAASAAAASAASAAASSAATTAYIATSSIQGNSGGNPIILVFQAAIIILMIPMFLRIMEKYDWAKIYECALVIALLIASLVGGQYLAKFIDNGFGFSVVSIALTALIIVVSVGGYIAYWMYNKINEDN